MSYKKGFVRFCGRMDTHMCTLKEKGTIGFPKNTNTQTRMSLVYFACIVFVVVSSFFYNFFLVEINNTNFYFPLER